MGSEGQVLVAETMDSPSKSAAAAPSTTADAAPPVDAPQSSGPPPFLTKTYEMVDDPSTHSIVSWSSANTSFVVWNPPEFAQELLPKYFKHNNFSSFVRQLNTYGFRKVDPDRWEFANEGFLRGRRDLLRTIHRRKPAAHPSQRQGAFVEVGKFGLEAEIETLKRDKNSLMLELVRMRQQQQNTERELQRTTHRLQSSELRQQSMISFLAKAMLNPSFFAQFVSQQNEEIHVMRKKRRLPVHADEGDMDDSVSPESSIENQMVTFQRSGLGEDGARDMLNQMFFPVESPPGIDTNHFDGPMREMDVIHGGVNRQSGVTLKEMTTRFPNIYSSVPIVTDVSTPEVQESTPVAQPFDNTRVSGGNGSEDESRYPHSEHRDSDVAGGNGSEDGSRYPQSEHRDSNVPGGNGSEDGSGYPHSEHRDSDETVEADGNRDTVCHEAEVQSARTDTSRADTARADTATHNSGFWSQFLIEEDPRPHCTDTALRLEREVQLQTQNLFQDDKKAAQTCPGSPGILSHSPGVDILSHQLGQLAPG